MQTCQSTPFKFLSLDSACRFTNLRELCLDLADASETIALSSLSSLAHLEHLELHSPPDEIFPPPDSIPHLSRLSIRLQDIQRPYSLRPNNAYQNLKVLMVDMNVSKELVALAPRLEILLCCLPDRIDGLFSYVDRLVSSKPTLRILNVDGSTLWARFTRDLLHERHRSKLLDFKAKYPSNLTWDINAVGMFAFPDPPFLEPIASLLHAGLDPKTRYRCWEKECLSVRDIVLHPDRTMGALLRAVCDFKAHAESVPLLLRLWSDVTIQQMIDTEPIHPIEAAFIVSNREFVQYLCKERQAEWDWFSPLGASLEGLNSVPLILKCLISVSLIGRRGTKLRTLLQEVGLPERGKLAELLNSPHPSMGTWLHFLASAINYVCLSDLIGQLPSPVNVDSVDCMGFRPVFRAIASCDVFPTLLNPKPEEYLDSFELPSKQDPGNAAMRKLLGRLQDIPASWIKDVADLITKRARSISDWLRDSGARVQPSVLPTLFAGLPADQLAEISRYFIITDRYTAREKGNLVGGMYRCGCKWVGTSDFSDFLFTHWKPTDFMCQDNSAVFGFQPVVPATLRVPLQSLAESGKTGADVSDATLQRLTRFSDDPQEDIANMLVWLFAHRHAVESEQARLLFGHLVGRVQALADIARDSLFAIIANGIIIHAPVEILRTVLAALEPRSRKRTVPDGDRCAWRALLGLHHSVGAYSVPISELLIEFDVRSPRLFCSVRVGAIHPSVLHNYMLHHANRMSEYFLLLPSLC